jgi:hypothetical protein
MDPSDLRPQRREAFLYVFLAGLVIFFSLLVLILISGGIFLYVLLIALAVAAVGLFHYVVWGRALSEEVAGEREEEQLRQRAEAADEWPVSPSHGVRRW